MWQEEFKSADRMSVQAVSCFRALLLGAIVVFALGGCTTSVTVQGTVPTPLVAQLPARVGVYYSPDFKSFRHEEVIEQRGTFKVDIGAQNLIFFENLMQAMFESVRVLNAAVPTPAEAAGLDGVIVPEILKYGFLAPSISGLNFYSASIHYRISLFDMSGNKLGEWTLVGYGKAEGGVFKGDDALGEATLLAIRDGGARIAIDLPAEPVVAQWLQQISRKRATGSMEEDDE
ncbi:MAG: hypothetical protein ACFHX7_22455 [Pseudomonadota bacterium]